MLQLPIQETMNEWIDEENQGFLILLHSGQRLMTNLKKKGQKRRDEEVDCHVTFVYDDLAPFQPFILLLPPRSLLSSPHLHYSCLHITPTVSFPDLSL